MTFDTTPLERDCVLLGCSRPAVNPARNRVHCAVHDPDPPKPPATIPVGPDPDTMEPAAATLASATPPPLDPATMEPFWNGTEWVLRPKRALAPHVDRQELVDLFHRLKAAVDTVERWLA